MKKGIEWLKEAIGELDLVDTVFDVGGVSYIDTAVRVMQVYDLIDQLDDQEVLSQKWIDKHKVARVNNVRKMTMSDVVPVEELKNLIIPKQEITEEQVMNWLDKNDFYDHITAETVLERVVDKGELSYYGTKYSVIKTPIIPQFVADWYKQNKYYVLSAKFKRIADWEDERVVNWYEKCTGRHGNNLANVQETIALMDLVGYEVEEEPLYRVSATDMRSGFWFLSKNNDGNIEIGTNRDYYEADWDSLKLTEQEIKDYDKRYWVFAKPVE